MTDVCYRVQWRQTFEGLPPFPWENSPIGWNNPDSAFEEMDSHSQRNPGYECRVVKVTTEACARVGQVSEVNV